MTTHLVTKRTLPTHYLELVLLLAAISVSAGVTYWLQEARYADRVGLIPTLEASLKEAKAEAPKIPKLTKDLAIANTVLEQSRAVEKRITIELETKQQQLLATQQQAKSLENRLTSVSDQLATVQGQNIQLKACIVDLKQAIDGIQAIGEDSLLNHRELNAIGKFHNRLNNANLLRNHLAQVRQSWTTGNCRQAQNTLKN